MGPFTAASLEYSDHLRVVFYFLMDFCKLFLTCTALGSLTVMPSRYLHYMLDDGHTVQPLTGSQSKSTFSITSRSLAVLHYAVVFLIIALIAAVFGFGGIASGAVGIAKILFFVFVIMAVITFVMSLLKKKG
jgi:uncharacterized membrane protein YtjA (UPF0391 family)